MEHRQSSTADHRQTIWFNDDAINVFMCLSCSPLIPPESQSKKSLEDPLLISQPPLLACPIYIFFLVSSPNQTLSIYLFLRSHFSQSSSAMAKTNFLVVLVALSSAALSMGDLFLQDQDDPSSLLTYHEGAVLEGDVLVSVLWYGTFSSNQKSIVSDFLTSLSFKTSQTPSLYQWWNTVNKLYHDKAKKKNANILLAKLSDDAYSMGKSLNMSQIALLAATAGPAKGGIAVVFTAMDVLVDSFCQSRCGFHGSDAATGLVYVWVGNPANQCPGQCAWPFYKPVYGPQTPALVAPNGDAAAAGMAINLAISLVGAVTNPYGDGFSQGPDDALLEAATACPGVYATGAYPGYAGELLADEGSGASYNANGVRGRKYVVPALVDPSTSDCSTII